MGRRCCKFQCAYRWERAVCRVVMLDDSWERSLPFAAFSGHHWCPSSRPVTGCSLTVTDEEGRRFNGSTWRLHQRSLDAAHSFSIWESDLNMLVESKHNKAVCQTGYLQQSLGGTFTITKIGTFQQFLLFWRSCFPHLVGHCVVNGVVIFISSCAYNLLFWLWGVPARAGDEPPAGQRRSPDRRITPRCTDDHCNSARRCRRGLSPLLSPLSWAPTGVPPASPAPGGGRGVLPQFHAVRLCCGVIRVRVRVWPSD